MMLAYWFFFIFESLVLHFFLPTDSLAFSDITYIFLIILNSLILIYVLFSIYRNDSNFAILLIMAFLFRLFLMLWSEYYSHIFALPNSGADEWTYYYNAMSSIVKNKEFTGYALIFSMQARVFGLSKIYGKFVNVLFSVSSIIILRSILIKLKVSYSAYFKTIVIACFLPNYAILSSLLLRESIIIFLIALSAYYFVCWWQKGKMKNCILSVATSLGAAWLHSGMIAYTLAIISIIITAKKVENGHYFKLLSVRTILFSVVSIIIVLTVLMNLNLGFTDYFRDAKSIEDIVSIADAYEDGGSAYNANIVNNENTIGFIINTPVRMLFFMFAPVPWYWRSATDIIAFLFSALFYGYVFFKTISLFNKSKNPSFISALLFIALIALMMFGWGVSNSGTALRHRDKMIIHYLIMFALIQDDKYLTKKEYQKRRSQYEV